MDETPREEAESGTAPNHQVEEDEFQDAPTSFESDPSHVVDHAEGMQAIQRAISLMLNNHYYEAEAMLKPYASTSMYHSISHATVMFLQATMSFEHDVIEQASTALHDAAAICNLHRKKQGTFETLSSFVFGQKLDTYSTIELQAEIFYSECNLLLSLITFLEDESLFSFIKGGLRIRQCYSTYKGFHQWILSCREEGIEVEPNFAAGVSLGIGVFNMVISLLPGRVLKLLEFVGFSGNRELGLEELKKGSLSGTFRSPMCSAFLLFYYTVIAVLLGLGQPSDIDKSESILDQEMKAYPDSVMFLYFKGRSELIQGHIDSAIEWFKRGVTAQEQWKQVHHLCWWEMNWCYCFKGQWGVAAEYAERLFKESKWSKATFLYQKAAFRLMLRHKKFLPPQQDPDLGPPTQEELVDMMQRIPPLKQRIAGKSIPVEKFVIAKSERNLRGARLPLCGMEMIYAWNGFQILFKNRPLLEDVLRVVWDERMTIEETREENPDYVDDWAVVTLMQGVCFKGLQRYDEAQQCFEAVVDRGTELQHDLYTAPAANMELGLLHLELGNLEEAEKLLESTRTAYKGYHLESRIHFRIHAGLCRIAQIKST